MFQGSRGRKSMEFRELKLLQYGSKGCWPRIRPWRDHAGPVFNFILFFFFFFFCKLCWRCHGVGGVTRSGFSFREVQAATMGRRYWGRGAD